MDESFWNGIPQVEKLQRLKIKCKETSKCLVFFIIKLLCSLPLASVTEGWLSKSILVQMQLKNTYNMQLDVRLRRKSKEQHSQHHTKARHACLSLNKMIRCTFIGLWLTLNERKQGDFSFQGTHRACSRLVTWCIPPKPYSRTLDDKKERSNLQQ